MEASIAVNFQEIRIQRMGCPLALEGKCSHANERCMNPYYDIEMLKCARIGEIIFMEMNSK